MENASLCAHRIGARFGGRVGRKVSALMWLTSEEAVIACRDNALRVCFVSVVLIASA
jgi:hypothetical protein